MAMFEQASRLKLRFEHKGVLSVEDLWDLPLEDLDDMYRALNRDLKETQEDSLLGTKDETDKVLDLKVKIIKHIVGIRLEEQKVKEDASVRRAKKQRLMEIIAQKQDEELHSKSLDELNELVDSM